ncbi:hypothetical protein EYZ11_007778 [Aspergillus tanneri]|uniref:Uncharacterized protein n=1 Tax=Aspergillus tanneri TaxID=1220188 RepID=A0A4S3JCB2_9EURO|nr:hypothetical protein EYZ11_007778 [Aspergillus tanneri]
MAMNSEQLTFASCGLIPEATEKLSKHFDETTESANHRWDALWEAGDFLPWDNGCPNTALQEALEYRRQDLGESVFVMDPITGEHRRKRALVPGCGRGYDVLLLASFGYDAYGLEVSKEAVKRCYDYARENQDKFPPRDECVGAGRAHYIEGDFFSDRWYDQVTGNATFELLFDYTVSRGSFSLLSGSNY